MKKFSSKDLSNVRSSDTYKGLSGELTLIADAASSMGIQFEASRIALAVLNYKLADLLGYAELSDKQELIKNFDASLIDAGLEVMDSSRFGRAVYNELLEAKRWLADDKDEDKE